MSSLLSRFAGNIFWLARYLERAENVARILDVNETYARDNREGPDWQRVLDLYMDSERFFELYNEGDAKSVLRFYILDKNNPSSIISCLKQSRENARSVRHLISTEMWSHLNTAYLEGERLNEDNIRVSALSKTLKKLITECQTFEGIAEGTFFRDEPWCFYQLGKYIERADQTTRLLDMSYKRLDLEGGDAVAWVHWNVLLRSVSGYHAFCARHPGAQHPFEIVTFLLYDTGFPRAVTLCVNRLTERLQDIADKHGGRRDERLEVARRKLEYVLNTGPGSSFTPQELHGYLDSIQENLGGLSSTIFAAYFRRPAVPTVLRQEASSS